MRKKPTLELPKYVHRVVNGEGANTSTSSEVVAARSPGPRMRLPGGPHTLEFWAAYRSYLGGDVSTGRSFNDLITAYKVSPEFTSAPSDASETTCATSTSYRRRGASCWSRAQAEARHRSARQMGKTRRSPRTISLRC